MGQPARSPTLPRRISTILGRGYRSVKAGLEGLAHPARRRRARARVEGLRPVSRVLVLCYGNICRSPYAAAVLERASRSGALGLLVMQGGFFGPDRPANDIARVMARPRGIDLVAHRSRLVNRADAAAADLIIVMESAQADRVTREFGIPRDRLLVLGDLDPVAIRVRSIRDPYGHQPEEFRETYERIDRCIEALATLVTSR